MRRFITPNKANKRKLTHGMAQRIFTVNFNIMLDELYYSQNMLANELGVSQSRVSSWIHGTALPSCANLYNLAATMNCRIEDFFKGCESMEE